MVLIKTTVVALKDLSYADVNEDDVLEFIGHEGPITWVRVKGEIIPVNTVDVKVLTQENWS